MEPGFEPKGAWSPNRTLSTAGCAPFLIPFFSPVKRQVCIVWNFLSPLAESFLGGYSRTQEPLSTTIDCIWRRIERRDSTLFCNISFSEQRSRKPRVGPFSSFLLQMRLKKVKLMKQLSYDRECSRKSSSPDCGTVAMTFQSKHRDPCLWICPPLIDGRLPLFSCKQMW